MNRQKAWVAVTITWIAILGISALDLLVIYLGSRYVVQPYLVGIPRWFAYCLVFLFFYSFAYEIWEYEKAGRLVTLSKDLNSSRLRLLQRVTWLAETLCVTRRIRVPIVKIVDNPNDPSDQYQAALIDRLLDRDVLLIGREIAETYELDHVVGIVAHELRHSEAIENKIRLLLRAIWEGLESVMVFGFGFRLIVGLFREPFFFTVGYFVVFALLAFASYGLHILLVASVSRWTELKTDLMGCIDTGKPMDLHAALVAIEVDYTSIGRSIRVQTWNRVFDTHPRPSTRRRILREVSRFA
jgi:Zn-dependent protease with chaperone function